MTGDKRHERVAQLAKTLVDGRPALRRQADDWEEGFNAHSTGTGTTSSGGSPDPVGNRVAGAYPDLDKAEDEPGYGKRELVEGAGLADQCRDTATEIDRWIHEGYQLATRALRLLPLEHPVAAMLAKHAEARFNGAGHCAACGDWVEGADYHPDRKGRRIDSGMCPTDVRQWRRTRSEHKLSAVDWATKERARRKQLADNEAAGVHQQSA